MATLEHALGLGIGRPEDQPAKRQGADGTLRGPREIAIANPDEQGRELQERLHPAASRVELLAERTPASLIAFDLLALGDPDHTPAPSRSGAPPSSGRWVRLPTSASHAEHSRPRPRRWFELFEGAGLDGLIAKGAEGTYQPDKPRVKRICPARAARALRPHRHLAAERVPKTLPTPPRTGLSGRWPLIA